MIWVSSSGLLFRSLWCSLERSEHVGRVICCKCAGDLHAVQHAGHAGGYVLVARLGILLRECGVVLRGAGSCVCVK
jgi:hypothetical protein